MLKIDLEIKDKPTKVILNGIDITNKLLGIKVGKTGKSLTSLELQIKPNEVEVKELENSLK